MNVAALFKKAGKIHAGRVALRYAGADLTYAELDARTDRLASSLRSLGLTRQKRVLLWMHNRPELVELLIAGWKANLTMVPVNVRLHAREVAYIAGHCRAGALAYDSTFAEAVASIAADLEPGTQYIPVGGDGRGTPHAALVGQTGPRLMEENVTDDDVAWLFYTSGTTGRPKGAMLTHRNLIAMAMNCLADIYSFQPEDVVLHVAPLSHGSGMFLLPALARGSLNLISHDPSFEPVQVFELIQAQRVTVVAFLAPTMIVKLIDDPHLRSFDLSSLHCVPYGGGPMYVEHLKKAIDLLGPIWVQLYGQGETPMTGTYLRREEHRYDTADAERHLGSAGVTRTDVELKIVGEEDREVPDGTVGEIAIRAATVMSGYLDDPAATREALRHDRLHTGDLGYMDSDGFVYIVDRVKDMIISGGNNIYPREVEEILLTDPRILEAAVVGVPDEYWGESVHALVVTRPGTSVTSDEVIDHCRANLASYKKPRTVEFVEELPKNAYGKVLKRELRWAAGRH